MACIFARYNNLLRQTLQSKHIRQHTHTTTTLDHKLVNNSTYTYGFYDNNGTSQLLGSDYGGGYYLNYELGNNTAYKRVYEGVYLVSDNYSVSIDESAIRSVAPNYNVSSPAVIGALSLFGLALFGRQKK